MLREAGYAQRLDSKQLTKLDPENGVEFFYLRPRDIAVYVGEGTLDVGITGRDLCSTPAPRPRRLCSWASAARSSGSPPRSARPSGEADLAGKRIATSYDGVVERFLQERGIEATVIRLDGAVESSIQLGVADVIADVVETGSTLRTAGLEVFGEVILESEAVMITRAGETTPEGFDVFVRRLQGVLVARSYVMMDYDIRVERVEEAVALTPGIESPTVSPLHREGWVAVRSMVPRDRAQRVMDELFDIGARGILTTDIHACRL